MDGQKLSVVPRRTFPGACNAARRVQRAPLGNILQQKQLITTDQLTTVLARQNTMAVRLGELLRVEADLCNEELLAALEDQWQSKRIILEKHPPDPFLVRQLGVSACLAKRLLPWRRIGGATVIIALYPDQFESHRPALEELFGDIVLALGDETDFRRCLKQGFPNEIQARNEQRLPASQSCRAWSAQPFRLAALGVITLTFLGMILAPALCYALLSLAALLGLFALTSLKAAAGIAALRRPNLAPANNVIPLHPPADMRRPIVSLLVPLYHEDQIAERLVKRLARLKYPEALLDICLIIEADDATTRACLKRTKLGPSFRVITAPHGILKTKPRALNYALDQCRGSIIGVYDAEDAPDPDQIARVVTRFGQSPHDVACLQGRLGFYNAGQNWLSRCFAIDYAVWFSLILPGFARLGLPIPLGGTTLFFRKDILEEIGAWDAFNVTEDADLGIRLTRHGYRTELIETTTLEEANCHIWPWVRQRSRWIKGYALTYATHMRHPLKLRKEMGAKRFWGLQIILLGPLVQALLAPTLWSWWLITWGLPHPLSGFLPYGTVFVVTGLLILSEMVNISLAVVALRRTSQKRLVFWIAALNPYFMLQTFAALKALLEMAYRPFFWDKTSHGKSTFQDSPAADIRSSG